MKHLFAVTYVGGVVSTVTYVAEDDENFKTGTESWSKVAEPKRFIKSGQVGTIEGKCDGQLDEWFLAKGVYEYWTESHEVAVAVEQTFRMAVGLPRRCEDRDYMLL